MIISLAASFIIGSGGQTTTPQNVDGQSHVIDEDTLPADSQEPAAPDEQGTSTEDEVNEPAEASTPDSLAEPDAEE
jgi:hypothetical protein